MAPHSSALAWKVPWTKEPGRLWSMVSLRVGHDWATSLSLFISCIGEWNGNLLQCSCLENSRDGGAWWAIVYGVTQSWTWLKWLSSSSSESSFQGKRGESHLLKTQRCLGLKLWALLQWQFILTLNFVMCTIDKTDWAKWKQYLGLTRKSGSRMQKVTDTGCWRLATLM